MGVAQPTPSISPLPVLAGSPPQDTVEARLRAGAGVVSLAPAAWALGRQLVDSLLSAATIMLRHTGSAAGRERAAVLSMECKLELEPCEGEGSPETQTAAASARRQLRLSLPLRGTPAAPVTPTASAASLSSPGTPEGAPDSAFAPRAPSALSLQDLPSAAQGGAAEGSAPPPPPPPPGRRAFVTLLTRDSYLPGAQALARSLRAVGSSHPLLVMHTAGSLSPAALEALRREPTVELREVARFAPPPEGNHDTSGYKLALYAECWTKLAMWELEGEYER